MSVGGGVEKGKAQFGKIFRTKSLYPHWKRKKCVMLNSAKWEKTLQTYIIYSRLVAEVSMTHFLNILINTVRHCMFLRIRNLFVNSNR